MPINSNRILAIDPGTEQSAWVLYDGSEVLDFGIDSNEEMLCALTPLSESPERPELAIEMVACYGMPVGAETFETCLWIGRFIERFGGGEKVYRKDVKMHLCHSMRAKDGNVRQALIDKFPATGGGKVPQIGTKKQPGPLYGVASHVWSALAVAVTYAEKN